MAELTLDQQRAIAMANARARAAAAPPAYDPTADMNPLQKGLANIGGGMMDLAQGSKSLWTDLTGTDEEKRAMESEVADKRAMDAQLADKTTGGKLLQGVGQALPLMAIPGAGLAGNVGRAGMAGAGALMGALTGLMTPRGADESRTAKTVVGGVGGGLMGAAAPEIGSLISGGVNAVTSPLQTARAAWNAIRSPIQTMGERQAQGQATASILREAGNLPRGDQRQAILDTADRVEQAPTMQGRSGLPLTTAAQMGDPALARLESGNRTRNGSNWYDFDQAQAQAADDILNRATASATQVGPRRALRSANYATNRAQAFGSVDEPGFIAARDNLRNQIDTATMSPEASNPAVRNMLDAIGSEMDRVGDGFGPEHLATIRANLSGKYNPVSQNAYAAAPRDSVATQSVLRQVDDILNGVTNGRWQDAVSGYARDSGVLNQAKAAAQVRGQFRDPITGQVAKGESADPQGLVPIITPTKLKGAMNASTLLNGQPGLSPAAYQQADDLLGDLRRQQITKIVKRSTTGGGGSDTAGNQFAAEAAGAAADAIAGAAAGPAGTMATRGFRQALTSPRDAALARALQDQGTMAQMLRDAAQNSPRGGGLWAPQESEVLNLYRAMRGTP